MKKEYQQRKITEFLYCLGNGKTIYQIESEEDLEQEVAQA